MKVNDYIVIEMNVFLRQEIVDFLKKLLINRIIMDVKHFKRF